ncbi:hypothetical protein SFA33_19865 [Escherichia coli]|nr:hypothetical protein [Escherichia coli]MDX1860775.1 hypothetical protein [Escherichia coli]
MEIQKQDSFVQSLLLMKTLPVVNNNGKKLKTPVAVSDWWGAPWTLRRNGAVSVFK